MAASTHWYGLGLKDYFAKKIDTTADTFKIMLLTSAYVPNGDTDHYRSDIVAHEVAAGGGYATGGITLTGESLVYDATTKEVRLEWSNVSWPASTISAAYAAIYQSTGTDATSILIGYIDFGGTQSTSGIDFDINFDATHGALKVTRS